MTNEYYVQCVKLGIINVSGQTKQHTLIIIICNLARLFRTNYNYNYGLKTITNYYIQDLDKTTTSLVALLNTSYKTIYGIQQQSIINASLTSQNKLWLDDRNISLCGVYLNLGQSSVQMIEFQVIQIYTIVITTHNQSTSNHIL